MTHTELYTNFSYEIDRYEDSARKRKDLLVLLEDVYDSGFTTGFYTSAKDDQLSFSDIDKDFFYDAL